MAVAIAMASVVSDAMAEQLMGIWVRIATVHGPSVCCFTARTVYAWPATTEG
ncbi:hypothetical protein CUAC110507_07190 [Cutibacterium acnes subsp. defendens]|nr:hypothetical protein HMPREF9341_01539 [Cutibacterium acnes HL103PA1]ERS32899.1 hypothetical protein HMPREF1277_01175 [Propionibacterium sp. KPL1847]ERS66914.1 hypothetical protein HMPREF1278_00466 [Propionibacterium sp. KPL1849]